jgi:hypothetical protein
LQRALGHPQETGDARDGADAITVIWSRVFDGVVLLRSQTYYARPAHNVVYEADRTLFTYPKRDHRERINDGILERQNRQLVGNLERWLLARFLIALFFIARFLTCAALERLIISQLAVGFTETRLNVSYDRFAFTVWLMLIGWYSTGITIRHSDRLIISAFRVISVISAILPRREPRHDSR